MIALNSAYLSRAETWLLITTLVYFLMNGAQLFETIVIVPKWTAAPPQSFQLFSGKYGLNFKPFWIGMHSIHEITFIIAIIFCWKIDSVRTWLLFLFTIHFAVRMWTLVYFAPKIMLFQKLANSSEQVPKLLSSTNRWRNLNYIRVAIFILISLGLIPLCIKVMRLANNS